jgi:hypothetical protein
MLHAYFENISYIKNSFRGPETENNIDEGKIIGYFIFEPDAFYVGYISRQRAPNAIISPIQRTVK